MSYSRPTPEDVNSSFRQYVHSRGISLAQDRETELYEWLVSRSEDPFSENMRKMGLKLLCMEYMSERIPEQGNRGYLDEYLPDEVIYSIDESERMSLVEAFGLNLKTYGSSNARWNGKVVRVMDPDVRRRISEYPRKETHVLNTEEISDLILQA